MQINTVIDAAIINTQSGFFIMKMIILGLFTFFFFFSLFRALEKQKYGKAVYKGIRQKWEILKHGNAILLIRDGVLQLDKLYLANITPRQIYTALRSHDINHLSDVKRLFLIPGGEFSIYKMTDTNNSISVHHYSASQPFQNHKEAETC